MPLFMFGARPVITPWPRRLGCNLLTSTDFWKVLPGSMTTGGTWDGNLGPLASLPPLTRIFLQSGSFDLTSGTLVLGDLTRITVPPPGPTERIAVRIAHGADHSSAIGTVSSAVPVTLFF